MKTIALAILIVILTISLIGIYTGIIINRTVFESSFLINILKHQDAYAQVRQLMLRLVNTSLPNSQEGMPYLREVLKEDWLEKEINFLLKEFYAFAKSEKKEPPVIFFSDLKRQVADAIDNKTDYQDKTKLVQFWFDPLPDRVRLEDFISIDTLWQTRRSTAIIGKIPWIFGLFALGAAAIIYLLTRQWEQMLLWAGASCLSAGALLVLVGFILERLPDYMSIVTNFEDRLVSYGIPEMGIRLFLDSLIKGVTGPMNWIGIMSILAGISVVFFTPIIEKG
ncbi:MAG: hypothetical protein GX352_04190 [Clostridiales bacterium]|nr:hypothetical protein [Clostridiales bacterium]